MAEEVRIDLKSTADTSGADKMGAAIGGLEGKSKGAAAGVGAVSKESKDMAQNMGRGIEVGNATTALMQNLGNASKGGADGMFAAARATASFGQVVKGVMAGAGPIGVAIVAIGLLAGAVFALKEKFGSSGKSAEDAKLRIEELNKSNLEAVKTQLSGVADEAQRFKSELEAAARAKDRISDAKLADKLATIKASDLSPEQKERAEVDVRRQREDEKRADAQKLLDDKADTDARSAARLAQIELDKTTAAEIEAGKKARIEAAEKNLPVFSGRVRSGRGADVDAMPGEGRSEQAIAAARELEAARRAAGPDIDATIKTAEAARLLAAEDRRKADEVAAASAAIAKRERDTQREEDPYIVNARKQTDKATAAKVPLTKEQQAARDESDRNARMTLPFEYRNRIAQGATVDREQLGRIYPGEKFAEFATPQSTGKQADGSKLKIDAKPLEKSLKDGNDKTREAIDAELAKVAAGVAAQNVTLTSTIAATAAIAAAQAATNAALEQLKSQMSAMRLK